MAGLTSSELHESWKCSLSQILTLNSAMLKASDQLLPYQQLVNASLEQGSFTSSAINGEIFAFYILRPVSKLLIMVVHFLISLLYNVSNFESRFKNIVGQQLPLSEIELKSIFTCLLKTTFSCQEGLRWLQESVLTNFFLSCFHLQYTVGNDFEI